MRNLPKLAEQQKNQRALEISNRIFTQTHDIKLAKFLSPITKKLEEINEFTKNLEVFKKSNNEDGKTQTPAIQNIIANQKLRDTLAFMK